jgi:hypothetical protein
MNINLLPFGPGAGDRVGDWLRANLAPRRTRAALVALAFVLGAAGLVALNSRDGEIRRAVAEKQLLVARIGQVGPTGLWHTRRVESDLWRLQAEGRLWEAETDGLAQANFQSWIAEQAKQTGIRLTDIRTSINTTANNPLKLRQISAQLTGGFEATGFFKLLQNVATHDRLVVVERLEIQIGPVPHFEMVLGAFLRPAPKA